MTDKLSPRGRPLYLGSRGRHTRFSRIADSVADSFNLSKELTTATLLAAVNSALRGKASITINQDWDEPVNAFFLVCAESGGGKSPSNNFFKQPQLNFQTEWNEQNKNLYLRASVDKKYFAQKLKKHTQQAAELDYGNPKALEQYHAETTRLTEAYEKALRCQPLELFVDDVTNKSLIEAMSRQDGRIAIMEPEVSAFRHIVRAKEVSPILDTILKSFSGERIQLNRAGEPALTIERPILALNIMVQPPIMVQLAKNKAIQGRGILGRFFVTIVEKPRYSRFRHDPIEVPPEVRFEYQDTIYKILTTVEKSKDLLSFSLSDEATEAWLAVKDDVESSIPHNPPPGYGEWKAKAGKHLLHLACLVHIFEHQASNTIIDKRSFELAELLFNFFDKNMWSMLRFMYPEIDFLVAVKALSSGKLYNMGEFSARDMQRALGTYNSTQIAQGIDWLLDNRAIDPIEHRHIENSAKTTMHVGRKKSPTYKIIDAEWHYLRDELL
jgi:hypothetical protein